MTQPHLSFKLVIDTRDTFYALVKGLNRMCGPGKQNWTMQGRILASLRQQGQVKTVLTIYNTHVKPEDFLFLFLSTNAQTW